MASDRELRPLAVATATAALVIAAGLWGIADWLRREPPFELAERLPEPETPPATAPTVDLRGSFSAGPGTPSVVTSMWPRFRGPLADGISREPVPLAARWPSNGPPVLWQVAVGDGHAGPAVRHGRVYLLDYDEERRGDVLRCLSLDDGREIWRRFYAVDIRRNHGISRTVPAVSERVVVSIGPRCHVLCVDAFSGEFLWGMDLVREQGAKEPLWYTAQCPLLDGEVAVLAPAGRVLMLGVEVTSGRVVWETPNEDGWSMSHGSVIPMEFNGRRMYVYPALGGLVGVAADGPQVGRILWKTSEWRTSVQAPSALPLPGGRVLITAGYGAGSALFQLRPDGDRFRAELVWRADKTTFGSEQQTPLFHRDHLFAVMPNDGGALRRQLVCYDLGGRLVWSSGPQRRFGLGPLLIAAADDRLLVMDDEGTLTMVRATADGYHELARATVLPNARDSWGPMALVDGRLLARESTRLVCLDLRRR
ncbi:MAG: PQQ-like beta-propeller repeat protein [Kiritimatiellae bacterium]|nr:PQQ-like beta-propeller repeat protein [Kiritimatiellia bacterium]